MTARTKYLGEVFHQPLEPFAMNCSLMYTHGEEALSDEHALGLGWRFVNRAALGKSGVP